MQSGAVDIVKKQFPDREGSNLLESQSREQKVMFYMYRAVKTKQEARARASVTVSSGYCTVVVSLELCVGVRNEKRMSSALRLYSLIEFSTYLI